MTDKKAKPKAKAAKPKTAAKPKAAKPKDESKEAELLLRTPYESITLRGRLHINGNPDNARFFGFNHRVTGMTKEKVFLSRLVDDPEAEKQTYLDNGWK